jgi:prostaglandin reductase 2
VLKQHPGISNQVTSSMFEIRQSTPDTDDFQNPLCDGDINVETVALSVDPYMRCMFDPGHPQLGEYLQPIKLNEALHGGGIGLVVDSKNSRFPVGSLCCAPFLGYPWKTRARLKTNDPNLNLQPVTFSHRPMLDLGALGMPGVTSWFCMLSVGNPQVGETVVVSGAAGACGSIAGQLAKRRGARVVGICGTDEKCNLLVSSFGFDVAINYKSPTFRQDMLDACPNGIDVYMDNVGGDVSDVTLTMMAKNGRVPICGQISNYDDNIKYSEMVSEMGVSDINTRQRLQELCVDRRRFLVLDYADEWEHALKKLAVLVANGEVIVPETLYIGFDPGTAFVDMMSGGNLGKASVVVHPDFLIGGARWSDDVHGDPCSNRMVIKEKGSGDVGRVWRW